MKVIQPQCRKHLTASDVDFLVSVLADSAHQETFVQALLGDPDARDQILDNRRLIEAVQDSPSLLKISTCLYFYILVRQSLLQNGIENRVVADYVAEMLAEFQEYHRLINPLPNSDHAYEYLVDLMTSAVSAGKDESSFLLRCHMGNYALFLSGMYPERIREREKMKAAPGIEYFENMGRSGFHAASLLHLASEFELQSLLEELANGFHAVRLALNSMAQCYLFTSSSHLPASI